MSWKNLVWLTAIVVVTLVGFVALWKLRVVVLVFLFSLWTAAALRPAVDFVDHYVRRRTVALLATYLAGLAILAGLALLAASPLANDLHRLGNDAVSAFEDLTRRWAEGSRMQRRIAERLPVPEHVYKELAGVTGMRALQNLVGFTFNLFGAIVHLIVIVVLSLYWSIDRVHFERLWLSLLSVESRAEARSLWRDMEGEVGRYLRSEVVQSLAAGMLLASAYHLVGYPYPALLAVVAAIAWLIPWLGVGLAVLAATLLAMPGAILHGLDTAVAAAASALATLAVLLVMEIWVEPRLFQRRRYNSLLTVLVVVALADVFGIAGLVLGPPVASVVQIVAGHLLRRQVVARQRSEHTVTLQERVGAMRAALASMPEPPAGLVSLADRADELVRQVQQVLPPGDGEPRELVYANAGQGHST
jgi:predicted PurR-regulated permease PerM